MAGDLLQPRVRVFWGDINLSAYNGEIKSFPQGHPVVYDVQVHLQAETEAPTAQMSWDPTGPGMEVYESFITNSQLMLTQIAIEIYYPNGKNINFKFIWTGQTINYGNDMSVIVKMQSELAGLINANLRSTAQAPDKGASALAMIDRAKQQFGLEKTNIVRYNQRAKKDLEKAKLLTSYGNDWTFGANISNIAQQTGNVTFANNIKEANVVLFPPFSWDSDGEVKNAATVLKAGECPDPTVRYGYILGPSIINSISRSVEWKSPQQSNDNKPGKQLKARDAKGRYKQSNPPPAPQQQLSNSETAAKKTSSPIGVSNARANPGVGNKDNPDAPEKQNALQDEKVATLTVQTFLTPVLVGVKPHDILYVPSLTGKYIEDWIVQSVDYDQNDGKVEVNIQATRIYGSGAPMNAKARDEFATYADQQNLIGADATLEAWDAYAWSLPSS